MRSRSNKHKSKFTQPMDSQPSPDGETEKIDDDFFSVDDTVPFDDTVVPFNDTVPFDDTVSFGDTVSVEDTYEMETQLVDLGGETQVLDVIEEYMETQLIDDFDTQVVVDSEDEGTDKTEIFGSDDELSGNESVRNDGGEAGCTSPSKEMERGNSKLSDDSSDKKQCSGPAHRSFSSIRAASLRASGLAARDKGKGSGSYSGLGNNSSSEKHRFEVHGTSFGTDTVNIREDDDQGRVTDISDERVREIRNNDYSTVRTSTVRRLFSDDISVENEELFKRNHSDRGDLLQLPAYDDNVAGLSYIDSQEPGDLSQANVLEFVDKFLQENLDIDQEFELGKSSKGKSKTTLTATAKGPQSLAKRANIRSSVGEAGVFDWDDDREDECGGDILRRKKEEFFGGGKHSRKSLTELQKPRGRKIFDSSDKDGRLGLNDNLRGVFQSDSKLEVRNMKERKSARVAKINFRKNLMDELDEECDVNFLERQKETIVTGDPQMIDVGFDTQLAAEAMDALRNEEALPASDGSHDNIQNTSKRCQEDLYRRRTRNRVYSKRPSADKRDSNNLAVPSRPGKNSKKLSARVVDQSLASSERQSKNVKSDADHARSTSSRSDKKQRLKDAGTCFTPIAHRTRRSGLARQVDEPVSSGHANGSKARNSIFLRDQGNSGRELGSELLSSYGRTSELDSDQSRVPAAKQNKHPMLDVAVTSAVASRTGVSGIGSLSHPKRRRSCRLSSGQVNDSNALDGSVKSCVGQDCIEQAVAKHKTLVDNVESTCVRSGSKRRRSSCASPAMPSANKCLKGLRSRTRSSKSVLPDVACNTSENGGLVSYSANEYRVTSIVDHWRDDDTVPSRSDQSPKVMDIPLGQACTTPSNPTTPVNKASPICMGDEYLKQSCKKNFSRSCLLKELRALTDTRKELDSPLHTPRRRRDIGNVRVLYSHHLDEDVVKQQKKKLDRLGVALASSIADATHFITDKFVRTKNMLEAIACGKPVVTHLWIDSCAQASCFMDEKKYILRDTKKEKELGFNMLVTLDCARKRPLLQGRRVLITPNTKPSKEIISGLVKAVHGQALERVGRAALKDDKIPDDLLILSCEEDYGMCVPFLKKGAAIFSSELLLNGIVTQKLEYERHRLFVEHVKRTRSTIWLRKDGKNFEPVAVN